MAFPRRGASEHPEPPASGFLPPTTKSDVVPALRGHGLPRLWDDGEDEETTGATTRLHGGTPSKARPHLTVMTGRSAGQVVSFGVRAEVVVGRARAADVRLTEEGLSRQHCRFIRQGTVTIIEDLESTNGTWVNGVRVTRVELKAGDRVQIGPKLVVQFGMFDETEETLARRLFEGLTRDALTGALNRRSFNEQLDVEVAYAQRQHSPLSILVVEVDDVKGIRATHGYPGADEAVKGTAEAIGKTIRASDIFCRYSDTQFALVIRDSLDNAARFAERVQARIARMRIPVGRRPLAITVSVGVAAIGERGAQLTGEGLARVAQRRVARAAALGAGRLCNE